MNFQLSLLITFFVLTPSAGAFDPTMGDFDTDASYSGTQRISTSGHTRSMAVRKSPGKTRLELEHQGHFAVLIIRDDINKRYMLVPQQNIYIEVDADRVAQLGSPRVELVNAKAVGREVINGHKTTRFRAEFGDAGGASGTGTYWATSEGILVRADVAFEGGGAGGNKMLIEMENLNIAPQHESWFEIPLGYTSAQASGDSSETDFDEELSYADYDDEPDGALIPSILGDAQDAAEDEVRTGVTEETRRGVRKVFSRFLKRQE